MKVLITGGLGYIGSNLAKKLDDVIIYDLKKEDDILDRPSLNKAMSDVDVCFHLAAISSIPRCEGNPIDAIKTNVIGTQNVMKVASVYDVKTIFASSFSVTMSLLSVYSATKLLGERIVLDYGGIVCRIGNVFGGSNFFGIKDTAITRLMKGKFQNRENWMEFRDYIHVDEVTDKLIKAIEFPPRTVVNICTDRWTSIRELVKLSEEDGFPDNLRRDRI